MSHLPERKEKICLNCKSVIYGRYCHVCGQQNTEPKESFWGLITHFVYDITHFDGKFFSTTKYLLFRPGYLATEYLRGRRASYLNPIRMYIFTSAFFFILFFTFIMKGEDEVRTGEDKRKEWIAERDSLKHEMAIEKDSTHKEKLQKRIKQLNRDIMYAGQTGIIRVSDAEVDSTDTFNFLGDKNMPPNVKAYDSIQASLANADKDGWFKRNLKRKIININDKYRYNGRGFWKDVNEKFMHSIPQMMFVSLPLVALILQLLYVRRKQFYYVNHAIFTVNLYIAVYIFFLFSYSLSAVAEWTGLRFFDVLSAIVSLMIFFYLYKSMRNFYGQSRGKTILKFFLFAFLFFILMMILMIIYFLTSALQI